MRERAPSTASTRRRGVCPACGGRALLPSVLTAALFGAVLAGCAPTSASDQSRAGLEAAGKNMVSNLEAGRYRKACEGLTAAARKSLAIFPMGGCSGTLAFAHGVLAVEGLARLGQVFEKRMKAELSHATLEGDQVRVGKSIEALYEGGRWRFEINHNALVRRASLRRDVERTATQLTKDGAGELLQAAEAAR
jgi:hypothetical protein